MKKKKDIGKIGKKFNPLLILLLVFFSAGILGFFLVIKTLDELRRYRGKGISGVTIFALPLILIIALAFTIEEINYMSILVFILCGLFLMYISFRIPYIIERESEKLGNYQSHWFRIGILQALAIMLSFFGIFLSILFTLIAVPRYFAFGFLLLVPSLVLHCLWIFLVQRKLNALWQLMDDTKPFATPEMSNSIKCESKDEYNA